MSFFSFYKIREQEKEQVFTRDVDRSGGGEELGKGCGKDEYHANTVYMCMKMEK
jgi:hypothetical protein